MKTKEEIEQLALQRFPNDTPSGLKIGTSSYKQRGFALGYNECQKDIANKKYTEEDMLKCWNTAFIDAMNIDSKTYKPIFYSDFINSLNKQD